MPAAAHRCEKYILTQEHYCSGVLLCFPVSWLASLVPYSENCNATVEKFVVNGVGKTRQEVTSYAVLIGRPCVAGFFESVYRCENLAAEGICSNLATRNVPTKSGSNLCLCLRQNFNFKPPHSVASLVRASSQGVATTNPVRSSSRRRRISARHAASIDLSSLPSRLSTNATTKAERSSADSPRAS